MAVALSLLHEAGLPHGCLRASNVYIKRCCNQLGFASDRYVFLTDVGLTTMTTTISSGPGNAASGASTCACGPPAAVGATSAAAADAAGGQVVDVYDYGRLMYEVVFPGRSYGGGGLPTGR